MRNRYTIEINVNGEQDYEGLAQISQNKNTGKGVAIFGGLAKVAKTLGVVTITKQIVSYATSRVGVESGNIQAQQNINAAMEIGGKVLAIGGAFVLNPVLGFSAIASTAIGLGAQMHTYNYEKNMEEIALKQTRDRGGIFLNRSRREYQ